VLLFCILMSNYECYAKYNGAEVCEINVWICLWPLLMYLHVYLKFITFFFCHTVVYMLLYISCCHEWYRRCMKVVVLPVITYRSCFHSVISAFLCGSRTCVIVCRLHWISYGQLPWSYSNCSFISWLVRVGDHKIVIFSIWIVTDSAAGLCLHNVCVW